MRIGIIGAGAMARALAGGWSAAGHEVLVGARSPAAAAELAAAIGGRAGTIYDAAVFGDVVLLALPVPALPEVLRAVAEPLAGRTVVDCTNAFAPDTAAPEGATAFVLAQDAVAEAIAAQAPGAHVVKAFNLCAAEVWEAKARVFDDRRLAVPICGDDAAAVAAVASLAGDLGLRAIPAGGLHRARYLEALSVFTVGLWFAGHDARAMFPPLEAAFAVAD
ncbi:NAD(P)-binding domain-containing protein [Streptomyces gardneri]|uniref:NADPH-dependent F420 reductase n=1 Tax=Nocardia TaxID=1817 RepID=UPI001359C632|nr:MULTISPECIES: NAD(P)-binding domain-containing protein [Nocardia]MBF6163819.1 NAD(P)-binding domain-containing protein [Streptomyces gardneri]MBF6203395.1 NAD(P)-binding domain-containing protein [Streptomyces gardneri]UAK33479.1 NAD(P)-binding domain-containing protein [Nocardia asteroides]